MMEKSPCHGCVDRAIGCHCKCEDFHEWKARQYAILEAKKQENFRNTPSVSSMKQHNEWLKKHGHS